MESIADLSGLLDEPVLVRDGAFMLSNVEHGANIRSWLGDTVIR